ncbi:hypothetical protein [Rickettsia fournieri]|nr:hypothetical protein [Rickettsia fournieri]
MIFHDKTPYYALIAPATKPPIIPPTELACATKDTGSKVVLVLLLKSL